MIYTIRTSGSADLTLTGTASDLYLALWNRGDDAALDTTGRREVLDAWRDGHRIRWS